MKVKELIEELQKYDGELSIKYLDYSNAPKFIIYKMVDENGIYLHLEGVFDES